MAFYERIDLFCYEAHGYMPEQIVAREQITRNGLWAVCPRCATGADPDPQFLNEIHYARIVDERVPTSTSTVQVFLNERLAEMAKKTRRAGWGWKDAKIATASRTLADDRLRDAIRRKEDDRARALGFRDADDRHAQRVIAYGERWQKYVKTLAGGASP